MNSPDQGAGPASGQRYPAIVTDSQRPPATSALLALLLRGSSRGLVRRATVALFGGPGLVQPPREQPAVGRRPGRRERPHVLTVPPPVLARAGKPGRHEVRDSPNSSHRERAMATHAAARGIAVRAGLSGLRCVTA
jgi:hypothetical protein